MRDKWMNSGCNEEELKPYVEPEHCMDDPRRIEQLVAMGYARADIEDSLRSSKFDDIYATYLLMSRRAADVSGPRNSGVWGGEGRQGEAPGVELCVRNWAIERCLCFERFLI